MDIIHVGAFSKPLDTSIVVEMYAVRLNNFGFI